MSVAEKDIWPVLKDLFLEQYKGNLRAEIEAQGNSLPEGADNRLQGVLKVVIDKMMQPLDDACVELQNLLDIDTATGASLDFIARLANIKRLSGESDASFKARVVAAFFSDNEGTPDYAIATAAQLSGDTAPQYLDEVDCTFFVYTGRRPKMIGSQEIVTEDGETVITEDGETVVEEVSAGELYGGGDQLYARQVKNLAPAGCLGLVGAAIQFADGNLMGDAKGRLVLMVADDSTAARNLVLVNDNLRPVLTSQNKPVRAVVKGVTVPKVEVNMGGQYYDGVRIKDLPDAQDDNGFFVRDSDVGGTTKAGIVGDSGFDSLWDNTPADPADDDTNETEGD